MITDEQLAELERLEREATPGNWHVYEHENTVTKEAFFFVMGPNPKDIVADVLADCPENAALIAAMRNALPDLLAEIRRLRATEPTFVEGVRPDQLGRD